MLVPSAVSVRRAIVAFCSLFALLPISSLAIGNIKLGWDPSPDASVVSYKVYYGSSSGLYTNSVSAGSATTVTVSNLVDGVNYYFVATAFDTNGLESIFSNETSGMVVTPNQVPTLNSLSNISLNEDAGSRTVNLSGISSGAASEVQILTVTASSSNPGGIPHPNVTYTSPNSTGSLTFTPVPSVSGSATITVTVNDGGASNNIVSRSFTVTVSPVNDSPTLNTLANISIDQDTASRTVNLSGISSGAANENQTLTITAVSSNPSLIPNPAISYTSPNANGSLTLTPVASAFGVATITVTVNDGGTSNNIISRSFVVTVNQINQPPSISTITNRVIAIDTATAPIPFTISDAETSAASLTLSANSDNQIVVPVSNIAFGGSGGNRTVTVTPAAGKTGVAQITITVSDGTATATNTFRVTVNPRPSAPMNLQVKLQ